MVHWQHEMISRKRKEQSWMRESRFSAAVGSFQLRRLVSRLYFVLNAGFSGSARENLANVQAVAELALIIMPLCVCVVCICVIK